MIQAMIIGVGVTVVMLLAAMEVVDGTMTVGDFVLVNTYMLQVRPVRLLLLLHRHRQRYILLFFFQKLFVPCFLVVVLYFY